MATLFAIVAGLLVSAAVYLILARDFVRLLLGLMLLTSGASLSVLVVGRMRRAMSPIVPAAERAVDIAVVSNPLPQAIILTAIVIGFGFFAFLLALLIPVWRRLHTLDLDLMRVAEPEPFEPLRPHSLRKRKG